MRRYIIIASILLIPGLALAEERVTQFDSNLNVSRSGIVTVRETLTYDFGTAERHGIFRLIPTKVGNRHTPVKVESVIIDGDPGAKQHFEVSSSNGYWSVKIGDPNRTVNGQHTYQLTYEVRNAINWFDGQPELYWNITGNGWEVPVDQARVVVDSSLSPTVDNTKCYTGPEGSQASACGIRDTSRGVEVTTNSALGVHEGLTVVARLSQTAIPEPTALQKFMNNVIPNLGYVLPLILLIILIRLYFQHGRDPKGRGTIIAEYEPPTGMSPAMLGYLIDERVDSRDITATIIGLASHGTLKISYEDKAFGRHSYRLTKVKSPGPEFTPFERELHTTLFKEGDNVTLKDIQKTLPAALPTLKQHLRDEAKEQQYFIEYPSAKRKFFIGIATCIVLAMFTGMAQLMSWTIGLGICAALLIIFWIIFSQIRTVKGVTVTEQIKGFKQFLSVTETERLKFHNAPQRKPEQFMAFLPFAIALGVEKDWVKQFASITIPQPDWYQGNWATFNTVVFASSLSDFSHTTAAQGLVSASSGHSGFSGGGFSGGGFGGGGGGGW